MRTPAALRLAALRGARTHAAPQRVASALARDASMGARVLMALRCLPVARPP